MRRRQVGPQLDRAPVAGGCPLELLLLIKGVAEMKVGVEVIRLDGDRLTQAIPRLFQPVRPLQDRPEIVMRRGKPGIDLCSLAQAGERLVGTAEPGKRNPEIVVHLFGGGVEPDRLLEELDRFLVIAALNRDDPEQVARPGMSRMMSDRFRCGRLGGVEPPGSMVGQRGLKDDLRVDGDDRRFCRPGR